MPATLDDVTKKLKENNIENQMGHEGTRLEITKIGTKFDQFFTFMRMKSLKDLEALREAKKTKQIPALSQPKTGGGESNFAGMLGTAGLLSALSAIGASMAGLDDAFKSLRVVQIAKNIAKALDGFRIGTVGLIDDIAAFVKGVGNFGRNLKNSIIIPDETKTLLKGLPDLLKTRITTLFSESDLLKPITTAIDNFKLGFDKVGTKAVGVVDNLLKVEDFSTVSGKLGAMIGNVKNIFVGAGDTPGGITGFFQGISDSFKDVIKFFPRIDFTALKAAFGSFDEGTGLLGFFGKIVGFLDPLLSPIKKIIGLALRPMFQLFLSVFDFLYGFYEGFSKEEGNLMDKLGAGIEGGIKGVIKGFTDAIDLILIELPAWLLKKLGFEGVAEKLKEFSLTALVDPAWEAVKKFFIDAFNNPSDTMKATAAYIANISQEFTKSILRAILPDPTVDRSWFDPRKYVAAAIPDSVYQFAGINPKTGKLIEVEQSAATRASKVEQAESLRSQGVDAGLARAAAGLSVGNSVNSGNVTIGSSTTALATESPKATDHTDMLPGNFAFGDGP